MFVIKTNKQFKYLLSIFSQGKQKKQPHSSSSSNRSSRETTPSIDQSSKSQLSVNQSAVRDKGGGSMEGDWGSAGGWEDDNWDDLAGIVFLSYFFNEKF